MMMMISLQGQTNYSMPPHLNNYIIDRLVQETIGYEMKDFNYLILLFSDQPILSRFPSSLAGSNSRSNLQIYSQLQVPSASNFGSMKKKKNGKKNSRSDASSDLSQQLDQNYSQNQAESSVSADASATYVPDFISITNKPVKVWMVVNIPKITGISNGLRVFPSVISKPKLVYMNLCTEINVTSYFVFVNCDLNWLLLYTFCEIHWLLNSVDD